MGNIILVTGGARSGKSSFAEKMASSLGKEILYVATSIPFDNEMKDRIRKHKRQRPADWDVLEAFCDLDTSLSGAIEEHKAILLDCITVMVSNILFSSGEVDWESIDMHNVNILEANVIKEIDKLIKASELSDIPFIIVTNEIGMGIVPENRLARIFRDIAGRVNQRIAGYANEVYLVVSGIPVKIK